MVKKFNGRQLAIAKEAKLKEKVSLLKQEGIVPELMSIVVGDDPASKLYVSLKKKAAEKIGAKLEIKKFQANTSTNQLIKLIKDLNNDESIHGVMVQLPLPDNFSKKDRDQIINSISTEKDVDGMRDDSSFLTPVVKVVIEVIQQANKYLPTDREANISVVGAGGFIGKKIVKVLKEMGYQIKKETLQADILISATGEPKLIKKDMVKKGAVVIDIGAPVGDVDKEVHQKASFITPVPGGVGVVTITCLLENLIEAASARD
jgi:methylenetetrahydrofolate dehydrogenase (NADP+)/methenyltetrahydrofolate cyclohydrolase